MAVLFIDGFSHYAIADFLQKWTSDSFSAMTSSGGRFGNGSLRYTGGTAAATKSITFGDNRSVCGFAWRTTNLAGGPISDDFEVGAIQVRFNSSGIFIDRSGTNIASTTAVVLSSNVYYHIGLEVVHHASAGSVRLQVNGADAIPLTTGLNTGATPGGIVVRQHAGSATTDFSDIYVLDGTGSAPWNALLGDCKVETPRPTAEGAHSDFTPSTGTDNALLVDETTPNGDTDYNSSGAVNSLDTMVTSDLATTGGTIFAVQHIMVARKTDAGLRQVAPVIRQGGTDYVGTTQTLGTTYTQLRQIYQQDPAAANWTVSNVNADEFGYKLVT
jgi:hypothetical protein